MTENRIKPWETDRLPVSRGKGAEAIYLCHGQQCYPCYGHKAPELAYCMQFFAWACGACCEAENHDHSADDPAMNLEAEIARRADLALEGA